MLRHANIFAMAKKKEKSINIIGIINITELAVCINNEHNFVLNCWIVN